MDSTRARVRVAARYLTVSDRTKGYDFIDFQIKLCSCGDRIRFNNSHGVVFIFFGGGGAKWI